MNRPMDRGERIDMARVNRWLDQFSGYRSSVTRGLVESWLRQFAVRDKDLAARILDAVLFISTSSINTSYRQLLDSIPEWHKEKSRRQGRFFFVPFSGSVGESGDSMVHLFRMATSLSKKKYNDLFVHRSELVSKNPGAEDTVVLIDDFAGTGNQACESWREFFEELLTNGPRVILMLVAATHDALDRISNETGMETLCGRTLTRRDNLFRVECNHFTDQEKATLLNYCKRADPAKPKGYGDAGLLLVLAHRCPNDTVPVLHAVSGRWQGLFPRHE